MAELSKAKEELADQESRYELLKEKAQKKLHELKKSLDEKTALLASSEQVTSDSWVAMFQVKLCSQWCVTTLFFLIIYFLSEPASRFGNVVVSYCDACVLSYVLGFKQCNFICIVYIFCQCLIQISEYLILQERVE